MEEERILLQILGPDFPNFFFFPRRTGMKRGLPAVSTRLVSQRFEDQLCADPTKLFDSYGWPTTCPSTRFVVNNPMTPQFSISKFNSKNLGGKSGRRGSLSLGQYNNEK